MGPYLSSPIKLKKTIQGSNNQLRFASSQMQGWRKTMEDAQIYDVNINGNISVFGVFDGHGGFQVSKFVEQYFISQLKKNSSFIKGQYRNALIQTFKKLDDLIDSPTGVAQLKNIRKNGTITNNNNNHDDDCISNTTGCTANVVLISPNKIFVANAGDSRAVLCRKQKAIPLSYDHKPQNQVQIDRIKKAGGVIINGRVNGGLNLTRSIGDFIYKRQSVAHDQQPIISKPDIEEVQRSQQDEFIIMGCDGIWQKYVENNQGMVDEVRRLRKQLNGKQLVETMLQNLIAKSVSQELGCDNMSIILIEFIK